MITVTRLKLTTALVSVKVSTLLTKELEVENVFEIYWTDSQVVLRYIANEAKLLHAFVANIVQKIRDHANPVQWK